MSCLVLSDEFFSALANELAVYAEWSQKEVDTEYNIARAVREYLEFPGSVFDAPVDGFPQASERTQALYAANCAAYDSRYSQTPQAADQLSLVRRAYWPQWSPVQFFKHLQCLHYQMCEEPVHAQPITAQLQALIHDIAVTLATETPEYRTAAAM